MIKRGVTNIGLVSVGRQVRGTEMDGDVTLQVTDEGIVVSPFYSSATVNTGDTPHITRFDQYNRLKLPAEMRRAAKIKKRVEISLEGNSLIITPAIDVCIVCGSQKNLKKFSDDKFICETCRKKMLKVSR